MEKRSILNNKTYIIATVVLILVAALSRLLPHAPNIAPITGIALFSSAQLGLSRGILVAISAMFLSDVIIGFHDTMVYVYGSFIVIALLGRFLHKKQSPGRLFGITLTSSLLFFCITNFGVWAAGVVYSKDLIGLQTAYIMGLPFFRNTLIGDIFYTFTLFYGYNGATYLMKRFNYRLSGMATSRTQ